MSSFLLDTHAFIWLAQQDPKLPESIRGELEVADRVCVSIASLWEMAIKLSIGKLSLQLNLEDIEARLSSTGIVLLPISFADAVQVRNLPLHHRDPFDRRQRSASNPDRSIYQQRSNFNQQRSRLCCLLYSTIVDMKQAKIFYFSSQDEQTTVEKLAWFAQTKLNQIPFKEISR